MSEIDNFGTRSQGRKISRFPTQSAIPADASLTYIAGGVNYQIPLSEFLASIGISGTIENLGPGTPVLDIAGGANRIRSIEGINGITPSIGPQDQLILSGIGIPEIGSLIQVLDAVSTATQAPVAVDTPIQIEFGPAQLGPSDPVEIDVNGTITFNQSGTYLTFFTFYMSRAGNPGSAFPFIRATLNGVQIGNPIALEESTSDITVPIFLVNLTEGLKVGDVVALEFVRDGQGTDDGSLTSIASTIGWGATPSARALLFKLDNATNGDTIVNVSADYVQTEADTIIFATGDISITMLDPSTAVRQIDIRNISGTTTLIPTAGTLEINSLTPGQSVTMAPRATALDWRII
jgi:hypothetical protein